MKTNINSAKNLLNNFKTNKSMKKQLTFLCLIFSFTLNAQMRGPLNGSGKIVSLSLDYRNFDKIEMVGMNGNVVVEVGKPFSLVANVDDNLAKLLKTEVKNGKLFVEFSGNRYNKLYIEDTHILIKISMPELTYFEHEGNGNVEINGISGRYFSFKKSGNAEAQLSGKVEDLDIKKVDNGNVNASNLLTKTAKVSSYGNGNVIINASESFFGKGWGNCSIINVGKGKKSFGSGIIGNGKVREEYSINN